MSATKLLGKIRADGQARVDEIVAGRDKELAGIAERQSREMEKIAREYRERIARETGLIRERSRSKARLERRKTLLAARWAVIEQVLELTREKTVTGPDYVRTIQNIIRQHAPAGAEVRLSASDTAKFGASLKLEVGEPVGINGGVLIRIGKRTLDFSLDESLAAIRDELASELAAILFPETDSPGSGPE